MVGSLNNQTTDNFKIEKNIPCQPDGPTQMSVISRIAVRNIFQFLAKSATAAYPYSRKFFASRKISYQVKSRRIY